jgi:hypothetical protein
MGGGGHYDLSGIGRIRINLLVAGHARVKADFTAIGTGSADECSREDRTICKKKGSFLCIHFLESCPKLIKLGEGEMRLGNKKKD